MLSRSLAGRALSLRSLRPVVRTCIVKPCCSAEWKAPTLSPPLCPPTLHHQPLGTRGIHCYAVLRGDGKVVPFNLPDVGEGIMTVQIVKWFVHVGDKVARKQEVCEVQSDKSSKVLSMPFSGTVKQIMYEEDDTATMGKPLLFVELEGEEKATPSTVKAPNQPQASPAAQTPAPERVDKTRFQSPGKVLTTPAVRRLAMEHGIQLSDVEASGKEGRVLKEDMLTHIDRLKGAPAPPLTPSTPSPAVVSTPPTSPPSLPPSFLERDETVPVKGYKAVMVRTMTASGQIPQFLYCDEIDMSKLVELRIMMKRQIEDRGVNFSYMPVIVKAISLALREFPVLNSHVDPDCSNLTYKAGHNIGIAMDTPNGLVVPNIKWVQHKSIFEIAMELNRLQELGAKGHLDPSDITGGTFSLSNVGAIGGTYAKPMLLPPEVAIGAFGRVQVLPRFGADGAVEKTHVMNVSWSADHRVIDGATVARFSNAWKAFLENPSTMLVDLK